MTQRVQTPDGFADFPDGMSDTEISAVLAKEYPAGGTNMVPLPEGSVVGPPAPPTSQTLGLEEGFMKPFENFNSALEYGANKLGMSFNPLMKGLGLGTFAENTANVENKFKEREKTATPGELGKVAGSMVGTLPALAATENPLLLGGVQGALNTDKTTPGGVATDTLLGMGFGKAGEMANTAAGAIVAPQVRPAVNFLLSKGVKLTPGQIVGGAYHRLEDAATSFGAPFIADAQGRSSQSFMKATVNDALSSVNAKLPDSVPAGHPSVAAMQDAFDKLYDGIKSKLVVAPDQQWAEDSTALQKSIKSIPGDKYQQLFDTQLKGINDALYKKGEGSGMPMYGIIAPMDGQTFKDMEEKLNKEYIAYSGKNASGPEDRKYAAAIQELQAQMRDMAERSNPTYADALQKINAGYAKLTIVERAAANTKDGVFTPAQFRNAVIQSDNSVRRRVAAAGQANMQDFATAGETVLPRTVPDSGTPFRLAVQGLTGAALFGSHAAMPSINPLGVAAVGTALAPYTRVGGALARTALAVRPKGANVVRQQINKLAPLSAEAASAAAIQHKDQLQDVTQ